jgi:hypothetical protein
MKYHLIGIAALAAAAAGSPAFALGAHGGGTNAGSTSSSAAASMSSSAASINSGATGSVTGIGGGSAGLPGGIVGSESGEVGAGAPPSLPGEGVGPIDATINNRLDTSPNANLSGEAGIEGKAFSNTVSASPGADISTTGKRPLKHSHKIRHAADRTKHRTAKHLEETNTSARRLKAGEENEENIEPAAGVSATSHASAETR